MNGPSQPATDPVTGLRHIAIGAILLSLFAPWFRFSDGGTFAGWHTVWMSLLPGDWTAVHVALLLTVSLAAAAVVARGIEPLAAGLSRWQPVFLLVALAGTVYFATAWEPWWGVEGLAGTLWGVWLTVACLAAALAIEVAVRAREGLRRSEGEGRHP